MLQKRWKIRLFYRWNSWTWPCRNTGCRATTGYCRWKFSNISQPNSRRSYSTTLIALPITAWYWAATLGQLGFHHVNNRSPTYVNQTMFNRGFRIDLNASDVLRNAAKLPWLKRNIRVYIRNWITKKDVDVYTSVVMINVVFCKDTYTIHGVEMMNMSSSTNCIFLSCILVEFRRVSQSER